jgi:hypothetical protein
MRSTGATGGDGSEGAPFGSIQTAIDGASGGEVIVVGAGTYRETLRITAPVTLVGACPEQTTIDGPGVAAIIAATDGTSVQNLRITADDDGVELDSGASILIQDVIIEGTGGEGIVMVNAAEAELRDVLIRDTGDTGIWVQGRGILVGSRVHVSNGRGGVGSDRGQITLTDSLIRDSRPNSNGDFGRGANIQNDAVAIFRRTMFDNNHDIGIFVSTANAELDRVVVQRTKSRPSDDGAGFGLLIQNSAVASVRKSWIDENHESNVYLFGATATFEDTILSHARIAPDNSGGFNIQIISDASATLRRVVTVDPDYTSINIGNGETVQLEDVTVLGSGIHPNDRRSGDGIHIQGNAHPALARVRVEDTAAQAIAIVNAESSARLADIRIARAGSGDCFFCGGLCLSGGAQVEQAERIAIEDALGTGVYAQDQDTKLVVSDISVSGTERSAACVLNHNVRDVGRGIGLYSADGSTIVASKFLFTENAESGAQVAEFLPTSMNTALELSFGTIRNNPIGATILIEGYDTRRLANFVVYSNNETNLNYE